MNTNDPAFPNLAPYPTHPGLTIRAHFAGLAMQAMIAKSPYIEGNPDWEFDMQAVADSSVAYADALILELTKTIQI